MKRLLITIIPFLILLLSFRLVVFDVDFYKREFTKHNVYESLSNDFDKNTLNLINYLKDKDVLNNFFNERERLHLIDVKSIIQNVLLIFKIVLILFILLIMYMIYYKRYEEISNGFVYGSIITMTILFLFLLFTSLNFNVLFTKFHLIFFKNNLWLLDPSKDKLIIMFPIEFFVDITKRIIFNSFIFSLVFIAIGFGLKTLLIRKFKKGK